MKELKLGDFKRDGGAGSFGHYFSYKDDKYEVCMESCLNGYDVAVYDLEQNLIGEKKCTNIECMLEMQIAPGFSIGTLDAINKALEIANRKYSELYEEL